MVLNDTGKCGGAADRGNPAGQLRVPYKGVATDDVSIGLGVVDEGITTSKVEAVLAGFNGIPFHAVLRRKLVELGLDDGGILRVGKRAGICTGTKV